MKAVVTLSKTFFPQHPKAGKPTYFEQKILAEQIGKPGITIVENGKEIVVEGRKKHTCRSNYDYWDKKIARLKEAGGVLSVRQWSGKPYCSPQETIIDIPAAIIGVQKLLFFNANIDAPYVVNNPCVYGVEVDSYDDVNINDLAQNDGLSIEDFKSWFKSYNLSEPMAIIHFTKFRYYGI